MQARLASKPYPCVVFQIRENDSNLESPGCHTGRASKDSEDVKIKNISRSLTAVPLEPELPNNLFSS